MPIDNLSSNSQGELTCKKTSNMEWKRSINVFYKFQVFEVQPPTPTYLKHLGMRLL